MPGPAAKPSALRLVEGTDRKGRPGRLDVSREPIPSAEPPRPPYALAEEVQQVWDETVVHLLQMGTGSATDANQLAVYCEAVVLHRRASRQVNGGDLLQMGDKTMVANKAIAIQRDTVSTIIRLAQEFGLTPASRTRVEVAKRDAKEDANPFSG